MQASKSQEDLPRFDVFQCQACHTTIRETIGQELPEGFQTAEYLLEHGLVDRIVHRHELKPTLSRLLRHMLGLPA